MQLSQISISTLDNETELAVALKGVDLNFVILQKSVEPLQGPATVHKHLEFFSDARSAIESLRFRGYEYGEELVRVAVSALRSSCFAA